MKIIVIGSGGREHAIAWKASQNEKVDIVYCIPGNAGTQFEAKCENVNIDINDFDTLVKFAKEKVVDLTIVGPEDPLVKGIVNKFEGASLKIFGPSAEAAILEGSKAYAKDFMNKYGVKTATSETFDDFALAKQYVDSLNDFPVVVKADGLAAGKGVVICNDKNEALSTLESFMLKDSLKASGKRVVIEEFLQGVEASILSVTDGNTILPLLSSKDHKQIFDGDNGPNTGGMGVIAPNPYCTDEVLKQFNADILEPTLKGIKAEKMNFKGIVFFGIMITAKGVYLLEYNVRMGDPETQAVLPLLKSDLVDLIASALSGSLSEYKLEWADLHSCCIVAASKGYPGKYETGYPISGIQSVNGKVFISGAKYSKETDCINTSGGRVLTLWCSGSDLDSAKAAAYEEIKKIDFCGIYYRKDIGHD